MFRPILITVLSTTLLSSCGLVGLQRGIGLDRAIENSMERARDTETEQSEFVTVGGVPMTVSLGQRRRTAFVRAEPDTASLQMMVQAAQSATGCTAEPIGDIEEMTGQAEDQLLSAAALRALGGAGQMALTC